MIGATHAISPELPAQMVRLDTLIQEIEGLGDPEVRERTAEIISGLLDLHGAGLGRMLQIISQTGAAGADILRRLTGDELTASLLLLYGLHPLDLEARVRQALDNVRPYLESHGGNVELLGIEDGIARIRLAGSCDGCPSSALTLSTAIDKALNEAAPDLAGLEVAGVTDPPHPTPNGFVPLELLQIGNDGRH